MSNMKPLTEEEIKAELSSLIAADIPKSGMIWRVFATIEAKNAENAELRKQVETMKPICDEIVATMNEYDRQFAEQKGWVDSPGGLKHMDDVWRLLRRWREALKATEPKGEKS